MMRRYLVLALALVGCTENVESTDVKTSGIYPEFTVTATGNGRSKVEARLKVGGNNSNTFLDLTGGDKLEVTAAGDTKQLDGSSGHRYIATFDVDDGGTEFIFSFTRDDGDNAEMSVVKLPDPYDLEITSEDVQRGQDDLTFTWDPPGDGDINVHVDGSCIFFEDYDTPDDGDDSVSPEDLKQLGDDDGKECTGTVELTRQQSGEIDSNFTEGGEIRARQVRTGTFRSLPPP